MESDPTVSNLSNSVTSQTVWSRTYVCFFRKRHLTVIFLAASFTRKMPESSDSMHSSVFMLENIL